MLHAQGTLASSIGGGSPTRPHPTQTRSPPPATHAHARAAAAGAYDAQDFAKAHAAELGMKTVPSLNVVYTEEKVGCCN